MTSEARASAYANFELEGIKLAPEFKAFFDAFADNKISQLEAFQHLGIDIEQIPADKQKELSKTFMNGIHKEVLQVLK